MMSCRPAVMKPLAALMLVLTLCLTWAPASAASKKPSVSASWSESTTGVSGTGKKTGTADNGANRQLQVTISCSNTESVVLRFYNPSDKLVGEKKTVTPDSQGRVTWSTTFERGCRTGTYKLRIDARKGKQTTTSYVRFRITRYEYKALPDAALQKKLNDLKKLMPTGKYWNHGRKGETTIRLGGKLNIVTTITSQGCPARYQKGSRYLDSDATCNYAYHGYQCHGWALMLAAYCFDADPGSFARNEDSSAVENLRPGDVVRYLNDKHTIFVLRVEKNMVYFTDCNYGQTCRIRWNGKISISSLKKTFTYVIQHP